MRNDQNEATLPYMLIREVAGTAAAITSLGQDILGRADEAEAVGQVHELGVVGERDGHAHLVGCVLDDGFRIHGAGVGDGDVGIPDLDAVIHQFKLSAAIRPVQRCAGVCDDPGEDEGHDGAVPRLQGYHAIVLAELCEVLGVKVPNGDLAGVLALEVRFLEGKGDMEAEMPGLHAARRHLVS